LKEKNSPQNFSIIAPESEETKCEGGSSHSALVTLQVGRYRRADKSLAQPGRKQAAPVKSVMGRGMD